MNRKLIGFIFLLILVTSQIATADAQDSTDTKNTKPQLNVVKEVLDLPFKATEGVVTSIFDLGSIAVTGKRLASPFGEFVTNTVSSTQVITKEELELSGARNLPEALAQTPGVILSDLVGNGEEPTLD